MKPYYEDDAVTLHHGDCLDVLRALPDASVDAVVTDPPYGISFMGREWDQPDQYGSTRRGGSDRSFKAGAVGVDHLTTTERSASMHAGKYDLSRSAMQSFQAWCEEWSRECLRILKPGGHLVSFGGSRTWHRLSCAVEDAGFEIRDSIAWLYGSGFPKSLDVSKAIDKRRDDDADVRRVTEWLAEQRDAAGVTNRQIDEAFGFSGMAGHWTAAPHVKIAQVPQWEQWLRLRDLIGFGDVMDAEVWRLNGRKGTPGSDRPDRVTKFEGSKDVYQPKRSVVHAGTPVLEAAQQWQGWGTALKPAFEPIVVGRKPMRSTVAANVLEHGVGAMNIDGCRTAAGQDYADKCASVVGLGSNRNGDAYGEWTGTREDSTHTAGRWPTNVVLDESQAAELDKQTGNRPGAVSNGSKTTIGLTGSDTFKIHAREQTPGYADQGGASRFFPTFRYEAKAPTSERPRAGETAHPTVKPLDLMRWLVRLVTPPGGTVLEPFAGSGTTAEACVIEGFQCIAIEREADYLPLIVARLSKPIQIGFDFEGGAA